LKLKLKGHNVDTIEVMEVGSQAVLNTLTEHDSRMHYKMAEAFELKGTISRVVVASSPKASF
jgi:hypothetical protein